MNLIDRDTTLEGVYLTVPQARVHTYTVRVQSDTGNTFDITQHEDGTTDRPDADCRSL